MSSSGGSTTTTSLRSTVDPSVVTKKEYQDICGVDFDDQTLEERLTRTKFLYPKHVEVIEDLAPIAGAMVDDVVSSMLRSLCGRGGYCLDILTELFYRFDRMRSAFGSLVSVCCINRRMIPCVHFQHVVFSPALQKFSL